MRGALPPRKELARTYEIRVTIANRNNRSLEAQHVMSGAEGRGGVASRLDSPVLETARRVRCR